MKLFIDSADLNDIRQAAEQLFIEGCTTNPSLLAKAGRKIEAAIPEICEIVRGPVSAEVVATRYDDMVREGRGLARLHDNVVIKVPCTTDGLRAAKTLGADRIRTNVTLCFSATQALLAARVGATFISPFVGRLDDVAEDGGELVRQIVSIYRNYGFETHVLAASIRGPPHVVQAALAGSHCATVPMSVLRMLVKHPLTDRGLAGFLADHETAEAARPR